MMLHSPSPSFARFVIPQFSFGGSFFTKKQGIGAHAVRLPIFYAFLVNGLASLFATCILDLEIFRGSLILVFCSCQLVTVDKKDMTT